VDLPRKVSKIKVSFSIRYIPTQEYLGNVSFKTNKTSESIYLQILKPAISLFIYSRANKYFVDKFILYIIM
jgi:hypothetical protein